MPVLDTDVMVDLLRGVPGAVQWLHHAGEESLILPGLVAMELIQGCRDKRDLSIVLRLIETMPRTWPSRDACEHALDLFTRLRVSHGIGLLDALIAATTLSLRESLYTFNQKHYTAIPGLKLVEPYAR